MFNVETRNSFNPDAVANEFVPHSADVVTSGRGLESGSESAELEDHDQGQLADVDLEVRARTVFESVEVTHPALARALRCQGGVVRRIGWPAKKLCRISISRCQEDPVPWMSKKARTPANANQPRDLVLNLLTKRGQLKSKLPRKAMLYELRESDGQ